MVDDQPSMFEHAVQATALGARQVLMATGLRTALNTLEKQNKLFPTAPALALAESLHHLPQRHRTGIADLEAKSRKTAARTG